MTTATRGGGPALLVTAAMLAFNVLLPGLLIVAIDVAIDLLADLARL